MFITSTFRFLRLPRRRVDNGSRHLHPSSCRFPNTLHIIYIICIYYVFLKCRLLTESPPAGISMHKSKIFMAANNWNRTGHQMTMMYSSCWLSTLYIISVCMLQWCIPCILQGAFQMTPQFDFPINIFRLQP